MMKSRSGYGMGPGMMYRGGCGMGSGCGIGDYPGLFLYHCHNLEHEDMGMMRNYLIG